MSFPPAGSCDCHVHVIGPKAQFPLQEPRAYTPQDATSEALNTSMKRLAIDRSVLIQISVYGTDNSCLLDGLAQQGESRARAVVVPDPDIPGEVQDKWHTAGVRGIRFNMTTIGTPPVETIREKIALALPICERNGWHMQFFLPAIVYGELAQDLLDLPVPCVLDHFAMLSPLAQLSAVERAAESTVMKLLASGKVWVKLSGTYRIAQNRHDQGIPELARRLHAENPQRMLWASDWPHTPAHTNSASAALNEEQPFRDIDSKLLLAEFGEWFPAAEHRRQILVENPATLYQFEQRV